MKDKMDKVIDVAVIGAGPAGLMAAATLKRANVSVVVFERGKEVFDRKPNCPEDVSSGVGGGGLFSDGKLSFYPSASKLLDYVDEDVLNETQASIAESLEAIGMIIPGKWRTEEEPKESLRYLQRWVKEYPCSQLSDYQRFTFLNEIVKECGESVFTHCGVYKIEDCGDCYRIYVVGHKPIYSRNVVLALGRYGAAGIDLSSSGILLDDMSQLEVGIRVAGPANAFGFLDEERPDYKEIRMLEGGAEARTFCCAIDGVVIHSQVDKYPSLNGSAAPLQTGLSNIGILIRASSGNVYHEELQNYLIKRTIEKFEVDAESFVSNEGRFIGPRVDSVLRKMLADLFGRAIHLPGLIVFGPEIERIGGYPRFRGGQRVARGIWAVGDYTGAFRGLMAALLSGSACARSIIEMGRLRVRRRFASLRVNASGVDEMPLAFTAQSKRFFYCRDAICEYVMKRGYLPVNPFRVFDYFLGDRVDRDLVRRGNNQLIRTCDELWVFGPIANGVLFEILSARTDGKTVRFFTIGADASVIEEIEEISVGDYSRIRFEPEVHAMRVRRDDLLSAVIGDGFADSQMMLFDYDFLQE